MLVKITPRNITRQGDPGTEQYQLYELISSVITGCLPQNKYKVGKRISSKLLFRKKSFLQLWAELAGKGHLMHPPLKKCN